MKQGWWKRDKSLRKMFLVQFKVIFNADEPFFLPDLQSGKGFSLSGLSLPCRRGTPGICLEPDNVHS